MLKGIRHNPNFTCFMRRIVISTVMNIMHATAMPIMCSPLQRANHSVSNTPNPSGKATPNGYRSDDASSQDTGNADVGQTTCHHS
jgi:hypothetical protein